MSEAHLHEDGQCHGHPENTFSITDSPSDMENRILKKTTLAKGIRAYEIYCPVIAGSCRPGQFLVVRQDETAERVPLTIADHNPQTGVIVMVVHIVGVASQRLDTLGEGDRIRDIVGPLGHPSEIENFGTVVCVGGGLGIAPVYPIQRALQQAGNRVISIIGARSKDLLFWGDRMGACADDLFVATDDGSAGEKGFVTTILSRLIASGEQIDRVVAIGPPIMMRAVAEVTRDPRIPTIASLNSIMVDGTGMCGGCRVEVGGETRFTCVDGPEFDAHQVNFDLLLSRLSTYEREENRARWDLETRQQLEEKRVRKAKSRVPMPTRDPISRTRDFNEVALGYSPEMARSEAMRCLQCKNARCVEGCPVSIDIPAFIGEIAGGHFLAAAHKLKEQNFLPSVCGRVCPQESQCEEKCILANKGNPIAIGRLERFAADIESTLGDVRIPDVPAASGKRVAVVGGGPAGLSCAADLAMFGHGVTIFEALHAPGGVLIYGIPEFRLPKAIVERECRFLEQLGVEFRLNTPVGTGISVPQLLEDGFDAVFVSTGAGLPWFLNISGENLKGVYSSNEFLTRVNLMKAYRFPEYDTPVHVGQNIGVIGGGNVAMDAARSALRLGAENVYIVYRRTRKEMPARAEEIAHALEEGAILRELTQPLAILGDEEEWVRGMRCQVMELGEPDASGRQRPVPVQGSEYDLHLDQVIVAIGQGANPILTRNWPDLTLDDRGNIPVGESMMTNVPGVFAGGDIVTGAATVIEAMGAGKDAARSIESWLRSGGNSDE